MKTMKNIVFFKGGYIILIFSFLLVFSSGLYGELPGDINNDGVINVLDKALLRDHFLERVTLSGDQLARADLNSTGMVNIADMFSLSELYETGAGSIVLSLSETVDLELVPIPSGSFLMGSPLTETARQAHEDPRHWASIAYAFYMGKYSVTKAHWEAVMGTKPWEGQIWIIDDADSPAVFVSWHNVTGINGFLQTLNDHLQETEQPFEVRLPSETEWEYAIRAGTRTQFYWGDVGVPDINNYAWWWNNTGNQGRLYAHVVGQKLPNAWGLYDMAGNAWEWCEDDYHDSYINAPADGSAWVDDPRGSNRILRGGSYATQSNTCRSAHRLGIVPTNSSHSTGFRIVAVPR